jgi:hypothetical protein
MVDRGSIIDPSSAKGWTDTSYRSLANSINGRVICEREMQLTLWFTKAGHSETRGGRTKRTRYGLENQYGQGGAPEILSVLYQFQFAGDLGALERQGGMIRQQLLEKLHRALIGGANFDGFDQT